MKRVWLWIKRLLFYIFLAIVFYSLTYLIIDTIFKEPIVVNSIFKAYINGFKIVFYIILILLLTYIILHIKKNKFNIVEILIFSSLIGIITLPSLYRTAVYKHEKLQEIKQGTKVIANDLINYFGDDDYSIQYVGYNDGCHLICTDIPTYNYEINNTKLGLNYKITINADTLEIKDNNLIQDFLEKKDIKEPLTTYLRLLNVLPLSVSAEGSIKTIDFKSLNNDYSNLNILSNSSYTFDTYYIDLDTLNKDEIIELSKKIFKIYKEYFYQDNIEKDEIMFYVRKNDENYAVGELKERFDGVIFLDFRTYNNSDVELKFSDVIILE